MSDPAARAAIRAACATAMPEDPHSLILAELAVSLGYLGYVDAARERAREALSEARQLRPLNNPVILITSSPHNLCHAWHIVEDRVMSSPPWNTAAYWREAAVQTRKLVDDVKDAPTRAMILRAAAE